MNTIAILIIVLMAIIFLPVIIIMLRILVGVCLAANLCSNKILPRTKQIVCTDYQVEEKVDSSGNTTFVITYE